MSANRMLASRWTLMGVAVFAVIAFSITNLPWQLDDFSQERQALASFGMIQEGGWLYLQAPRDREATKPPLIPYVSAAIYGATRSWDIAWRLPSFAAAVALALLLFRFAGNAFGRPAAVLALSAFALNHLSPRLASLVRTDMPLALIVFVLGAQIWEKVRAGSAWDRGDRTIVFALLLIGAFIKGPIIYLFLLPAIAAFQICFRRGGRASAWCGWWPWVASLAIFLFWVIGGLILQPGFFDQVIVHEFLGRFSSAEQRPHPPYYYVAHLLVKFAPWSELLLLFAIFAIVSRRQSMRRALSDISPGTVWLICWALSGLLIMSVVPSKRLDRIYPSLSPLCLLLAAQFTWLESNERLRRRVSGWANAAVLLGFLIASQYVAAKIYLGYRDQRDVLSRFGGEVRHRAEARHWRYEIVESHDGGMLLYLAKTHFVQPAAAVAQWNAGQLDALVVRSLEAPALLGNLEGGTTSDLRCQRKDDPKKAYVLIVRDSSLTH
jgi:4-amino-4-deoxy-L-arabinose transferase-like glycosyltransferase